jgi:tetratricopeptide (TPR) repeat protein
MGEGYFRVRDGQGHFLYTRKGTFTLGPGGEVVTGEGYSTGVSVPEGTTLVYFSKNGELTGADRQGEKKVCGKIALYSLTGPLKKQGACYVGAEGAAPGDICLAAGFYNRQGLFVDESSAWQLLRSIAGNDDRLIHLFCDGLRGNWNEIDAQEKELEATPALQDFLLYLSARACMGKWVYAEQWDLRGALKKFEAMSNKDIEPAWFLRESILYYLEGKNHREKCLREAAQSIENLCKEYPESPDALFLLAWVHDIAGQAEAASGEYGTFLSAQGREASVPLRLRIQIDWIAGRPDFAFIETLMPGHTVELYSALSAGAWKVLESEGKKNSDSGSENAAKPSSEKMVDPVELSGDEKILYAHYRRGALLEKSGDLAGAIQEYRKYVQLRGLLNPRPGSFISRDIIRAYFNAGLLDEVRNELFLMKYDYRYLNKSLANLYTMLGKAYEQKGEPQKARECYLEAKEIQSMLKNR